MKNWREWSDDRLWITWGVFCTVCVVIVAWVWV